MIYLFSICKGHQQHTPLLIYSTTADIRITPTDKVQQTVLMNVSENTMIDFHYQLQKLCWCDHNDETLQCADFDGNKTGNRDVIIHEAMSPQGIACDWLTNKIYWTDSETNRIEVASMVGPLYRKVLFWTEIDQPRAIALAPMKGLMFWTDWGENSKIERAGMNGDIKTRKTLVNRDIYWPNGITVDHETETIYWVDGREQFMDSMDYNGENRKHVAQHLSYPVAVTKFSNKIYWTDWKNPCIYVYDSSSQVKQFLKATYVPVDVRVWHETVQPKHSHPCEKNNGNCSHLCLLSPDPPGYTCACPFGIKLLNETTCSDGPKEVLVFARRIDICVVYLDSPEYTYKTLNLTNTFYTIGVDYDPVEGYIYWTDDEILKIQKAKLDGTRQKDVITQEILHPDGIAMDWIARNLYWADAEMDRIEITTLSGKYRKIIIEDGLYEPRAIVVTPELGLMFWTDWNESAPKIERANLDGTDRTIIISSKLEWPNGVAVDWKKQKVYWCDAKTHKIEYANIDGSNRITLLDSGLPHPFGFSLMGDFIYWTDWQKRSIERVHKETGASREVILDQIPDVMGLKAIDFSFVSGTNPCGIKNGGCSHFCLYRHDKTHICACPIEYDLDKDGRSCFIPEVYYFYSDNGTVNRMDPEMGYKIALPIKGIKFASSIDFDYNNNRIYWSDNKQRTIMRAYANGSDPQRVIELGLISPEGIAVDWSALNIYWTDIGAHKIEVARLTGSGRRVLLWGNIEPYSIALDPPRGYMYWSEWGQAKCIKKAFMDGTNTKVILENVGYAVGLLVDFEQKRLFWADSLSSTIMSSDFQGFRKQMIVSSNGGQIGGLAMFRHFLYWINVTSAEIWRANKMGGDNVSRVVNNINATDVTVFHKSKQEGYNQCKIDNGGCSHLCLALPSQKKDESATFTCACPTHFVQQNKTCVPPKKFMIYSQKNLAMRLLPDSSDCLEAVLPIQSLKSVKAIDFDPENQYLYWIEGKTHTIKKADATGTHPPIIVIPSENSIEPFDLAIDALGRLLFWTCAKRNVINVTRLENSSTVGVVVHKEGEKPRFIIIHPLKRLIFYTNVIQAVSGTTISVVSTQLIRTRMDGSHHFVITTKREIAAIALDIEKDLLVWVEGESVHMCNIDGENQHVLWSESKSKITSIAVHLGWLFWLDKTINQLQRIKLSTGQDRQHVLNHAHHILDLVSVLQPDRNHSCAQTNRCSHLCIINGTNAVCACPHGLALADDKRNCVVVPGCSEDHFTCATHEPNSNGCIPLSWRCDSQVDCPDGSDELGCTECKSTQFKCRDLHCIEKNQVCDGIFHCQDGSDEEACCMRNQFQCPKTGVCISTSLLCDGVDNCADGADEFKSACKEANRLTAQKSGSGIITTVIMTIMSVVVALTALFYILRRKCDVVEMPHEQTEDLLNPSQSHGQIKGNKIRKTMPDVLGMTTINGSQTSTYDRNNITGASSSTNGSSVGCYPRETLNPPPSPATTAASTRGSSPSSRYRPYRHYRAINQPPPPTPCSTDVCDESDYNYPTSRSRYDGGPFPPPPTPRSHCHSESCPPSPSSRSSTYFSPLPPPPSPVASPPRGYDS
ncbi:hypothetical protein Trydic_g7648 [Trypoxylus dichotomus]